MPFLLILLLSLEVKRVNVLQLFVLSVTNVRVQDMMLVVIFYGEFCLERFREKQGQTTFFYCQVKIHIATVNSREG